ncbi:hypothetical protein C8J57DRAFT_1238153 [Mycena rebaudengoi]|nr:hypothetical protein C8J57DRAFT_1238153 [Mycena rebaudengoi]
MVESSPWNAPYGPSRLLAVSNSTALFRRFSRHFLLVIRVSGHVICIHGRSAREEERVSQEGNGEVKYGSHVLLHLGTMAPPGYPTSMPTCTALAHVPASPSSHLDLCEPSRLRPAVTLRLPTLTRAVLVLRARPARSPPPGAIRASCAVDLSLLALQSPTPLDSPPIPTLRQRGDLPHEKPTHHHIHPLPSVRLLFGLVYARSLVETSMGVRGTQGYHRAAAHARFSARSGSTEMSNCRP